MIKNLLPNFSRDSRQLIASKIVIAFSISATGFFSLYNFIKGTSGLFYIDISLFSVLLFLYFILIKKSIYLLAKISIIIMSIGLVFLVYYDDGMNSTHLWTFVALFYLMFMFGPKKGLFYSSILFIIIFFLMYNYVGVSITSQGYVRFLFISVALVTIAFAYEHSIGITLARLEKIQKELEQMVKTDGLTTLFNRRYFDEIFPKQIKIARRNHKLLVFAIVDIDNFKDFNDEYGHQAGDEVLKAVSLSFKKTMHRPDDFVFRLGGEEFGILFNSDDKEKAIELVEKMRENIVNLKIAHTENEANPYVTVSIGLYVAEPSDKSDYEMVYKICDDALYMAKEEGKNRVKLAQS